MDHRRAGALLLALALAAAPLACSDDDGAADGSLARCVAPDESAPPGRPEIDSDVHIAFDDPVAQPGIPLVFEWDIPSDQFTTADETKIECWDGETWVVAWFAVGMYGPDHSPRAVVDAPENMEFTDDGFSYRIGRIAVPDAAPPGTYRIVEWIGIDEFEADRRLDVEIEARFLIE